MQTYQRGMDGLIAGDTAISKIDGQAGQLWYRGVPIAEVAARADFEAVAYFVIFGEWPEGDVDRQWRRELAHWRTAVPAEAMAAVATLPKTAPPLANFRTAMTVAALYAPERGDVSLPAQRRRPARILAWSGVLAAAVICHSLDGDAGADGDAGNSGRAEAAMPATVPENRGYAADFLARSLGRMPEADAVLAFDVSLIVQAEHDIHAAALAALTVASAGADLDGAVMAGIGALSGSLHGGANQPAFERIVSFATPDQARDWAKARVAEKHRFPGFGHRVYKTHDPRGTVLAPLAQQLLRRVGRFQWWEIYDAMRDEIETAFGPKGIFANIDAFTGLVYAPIGLPISAFTIPFCLAIQAGWMAHALEYLPHNVPVHPRSIYTGPMP